MSQAELSPEIKEKLEGDTKVLYTGTAENVKPFDETHKTANIIRAAVGAVLAVFCLTKIGTLSTGIIAFAAIILLYAGFAEAISTLKLSKIEYYITEKHLATKSGMEIHVLPIEAIDAYKFIKDSDGHNYLVIGNCKTKMYSLRSLASASPRFDENGKCTEAVYYAMTDFDSFKCVFEALMKN